MPIYVNFHRKKRQTREAWIEDQIWLAMDLDPIAARKRLAHLAVNYDSGVAWYAYGCHLHRLKEFRLAADAFQGAITYGYDPNTARVALAICQDQFDPRAATQTRKYLDAP